MNTAIVQMCTVIYCAASAIMDLAVWRISNFWTYSFAVAGIFYRVNTQGFDAVLDIALTAAAVFIIFGWTFYLKMMGAGDIKLIFTVGIWYGGSSLLGIMLSSFIIAAVLSFLKLMIKRENRERWGYFIRAIIRFFKTGVRTDYIKESSISSRVHISLPVFAGVLLKALGVY